MIKKLKRVKKEIIKILIYSIVSMFISIINFFNVPQFEYV